jgi:hypothetical protein
MADGSIARWYDALRRALFRPVRIYGLFYRFVDLFEETVAALKANTDVDYRLFVVENASAESPRNSEIVRAYVDRGDVEGYVLLDDNVYGSAFEYLYRRFFPPDPKDDVVVFSDLDLRIPPTDRGWLRRMLMSFATYPEIITLSLDFDLGNWNRALAKGHIPPDERRRSRRYGIYRQTSGIWFLAMRNRFIDEYLDGTNVFGDREIFRYIDKRFSGRVYGRLPVRCHHLSWDLEERAADYVETKYEEFYAKVYQRHECPEAQVYSSSPRGCGAAH